MKELKPENGITQVSLYNLGLLTALHGPVRFILHHAPIGSTVNDATLIGFQDGHYHRANGLSTNWHYRGYVGEGPHGLLAAIETYLKRRDITLEHINSWRGKKYLILPGKGSGKMICHLDTHTEVW